MIVGLEVGLLICGLFALFAGRLPTPAGGAKHEVRGWPARVIGFICLLPIPLTFAAVRVAASLMAAEGKNIADQPNRWIGTAIELGMLAVCFAAIIALRLVYRTPARPE